MIDLVEIRRCNDRLEQLISKEIDDLTLKQILEKRSRLLYAIDSEADSRTFYTLE